ncbi:MAG: hypothetical protein FJ122_07305 [Deltaproteobacteria bacterium]|nr:hypothetical protein [Deltaproteobacteria bacterium]
MKLKIIIYSVILALLTFSLAWAEGGKVSGEVTVTGTSVKSTGNEASFNEFEDKKSGVSSALKLDYDSNQYFLNLTGDDIGLKTQAYRLDGGMYGKFKYFLDYNEIVHNFTFGARTFYSGVGTDNLTYTATVPAGGTAAGTFQQGGTVFDYSSQRKRYGGGFKLDLAKPFYFSAAVSREEKSGIRPTAAGAMTGGGYGLELPEPTKYQTDVLKVEAGYASKPFFVAANVFFSEFRNDIEKLFHRNPAYAVTAASSRPDVITLPPDNSYYKVSLKGGVALPLDSRFSVNVGFSKTKSDVDLLTYRSDAAAAGWASVGLSKPNFKGDLESQNVDLNLSSAPLSFLDAKVYYKYYKKSNKSDSITTTDGTTSFRNHIFDYNKEGAGASFGIKLPANLKLTPAYSYQKVNRERGDFPQNVDHTYSADLKWSGLDILTAKVGYERLNRTGDWKLLTLVTGTQETANALEPFIRRFDVAPVAKDTYSASIELFPLENLNVGLGYRNKKSNFKDTVMGIREDKSDEVNFDVSYAFGKYVKLSAYYDYEKTRSFQFQRRANAATVTAVQANPATAPTASYYNWDLEQTFTTDSYGAGIDVFAIPNKLTFTLRYDSVKSDGFADYNLQWLLTGQNQDNIDIGNWEDYKKQVFHAKAVYEATKNLAVTVGYAYEKYDYSDALYDGYRYIATSSTGAVNNYLTGAYMNPPYDAHRVYIGLTYKF